MRNNNIFILYRSEFFRFYADLNLNYRLNYVTNDVKRSSTRLFSTSEEYIIIKHNK